MPVLPQPLYQRPLYLFNGHAETIVPSLFRKVQGVVYSRERLELADGDFLDLDWLRNGQKRVAIISHGLEGSSDRHYVKSMARYLGQHGWDVLAWNCRSCSGEMNRLPRLYHHGATDDLSAVIDHARLKHYDTVALVGFSMGGSLTLKYLGERGLNVPPEISAAVAFSVPCHLGSSARELDKPEKAFYRDRFLKKLKKKMIEKAARFPDLISVRHIDTIRTFADFDNAYTAPLHGFTHAEDFYQRASSGQYLAGIRKPVLIVNAENDPFLPKECYPVALAQQHDFVHLEMPTRGGHVGFSLHGKSHSWMDERALGFLSLR
ncbi:MAG: alpha/beta fold hydrolase [Cyclobacteriaceae bacterium]|nr:alpha/beta fold hydrolase [Cyclobacteriaceae bacterium]